MDQQLERPYNLRELAVLHGLSYMSVLRIYEHEPGVLILQASPEHQRRIGRRYRRITVPRHVYARVRHRMEVK